MKKILASSFLIFLVGCVNYKDNFNKNLNSTGAYVANNASNTISQYYVDSSTYQLTTLGTIATETSPTYVAMHPNSKFVYAVNSGSVSVSVYSINTSTRKLTLASTTNITGGVTPGFIIFNSAGTYAYVADSGASSITSYFVTTSSGALSSPGTYTPGCAPTDMAIVGSILYAACGTVVISYAIDTTTGSLSSMTTSAPAAAATINYITPNPGGTLLMAGQADGAVAALTIDGTGAMSAYSAGTITGCSNIFGIFHNSGGSLAWVVCKGTNNIVPFTVSGTTYNAGTAITVGTSPTAMAFAGNYAYAYVVNSGDNAIGLYSIDSSTGALTLSTTIGTDNTPTNLVGY